MNVIFAMDSFHETLRATYPQTAHTETVVRRDLMKALAGIRLPKRLELGRIAPTYLDGNGQR